MPSFERLQIEEPSIIDENDESLVHFNCLELEQQQNPLRSKQKIGLLLLGLILLISTPYIFLTLTHNTTTSNNHITNAETGDTGDRETHVITEDAINPAKLMYIENEEVVCMDGIGKGRYYLRKSITQKKTWLLRFRAGPDRICYDQATCEMTGFLDANTFLPEEDEIDPDGGIMSANETQNPHFWDWNQVQPHYCTYDLWLGIYPLYPSLKYHPVIYNP